MLIPLLTFSDVMIHEFSPRNPNKNLLSADNKSRLYFQHLCITFKTLSVVLCYFKLQMMPQLLLRTSLNLHLQRKSLKSLMNQIPPSSRVRRCQVSRAPVNWQNKWTNSTQSRVFDFKIDEALIKIAGNGFRKRRRTKKYSHLCEAHAKLARSTCERCAPLW